MYQKIKINVDVVAVVPYDFDNWTEKEQIDYINKRFYEPTTIPRVEKINLPAVKTSK